MEEKDKRQPSKKTERQARNLEDGSSRWSKGEAITKSSKFICCRMDSVVGLMTSAADKGHIFSPVIHGQASLERKKEKKAPVYCLAGWIDPIFQQKTSQFTKFLSGKRFLCLWLWLCLLNPLDTVGITHTVTAQAGRG